MNMRLIAGPVLMSLFVLEACSENLTKEYGSCVSDGVIMGLDWVCDVRGEFRCLGTACGQAVVQQREYVQYCTGYSERCNGRKEIVD